MSLFDFLKHEIELPFVQKWNTRVLLSFRVILFFMFLIKWGKQHEIQIMGNPSDTEKVNQWWKLRRINRYGHYLTENSINNNAKVLVNQTEPIISRQMQHTRLLFFRSSVFVFRLFVWLHECFCQPAHLWSLNSSTQRICESWFSSKKNNRTDPESPTILNFPIIYWLTLVIGYSRMIINIVFGYSMALPIYS